MRILVIDNFDSFTYNLVHYCEPYAEVIVRRNDELELPWVAAFDKIILSPGPGLPRDAGLTMEVLRHFSDKKNILGVCLGLQAIVEHYGGRLKNLPQVLHGVDSECCIHEPDTTLFQGLPHLIRVGHYHSWAADETCLPEDLVVTATNEDGHIMALQHRSHRVVGVQFHPESVMTPEGRQMIKNWCLA